MNIFVYDKLWGPSQRVVTLFALYSYFFCFSFWYWPKGGLTLNDSTNFQAFKNVPTESQNLHLCSVHILVNDFIISNSLQHCLLASLTLCNFLKEVKQLCFAACTGLPPLSANYFWCGQWVRQYLRKEKNWANVWLIGKSWWKLIHRLFYEIPI